MANSEDNVNFKITQGDTFAIELQYLDEDDNVIDISGYQFRLEVRDKPAGQALCAVCTNGDGFTITDAQNGIVNLEVSPEKTRKFNYPKSAYQIQSTDEANRNSTWIQGWFQVNAGVIP